LTSRHPGVSIIIAAITVAAIEVGLHWLLSRGTFPTLSAIYLPSNYTRTRDDFAGVVDNLGPAAILGLVSGWVAFPRWSLRKLTAAAIGIAIFLAALEPAYWGIIGWHHYYGVQKPNGIRQTLALFPLFDFFTACIPCLLFANMTYRGRRELASRKSMNLPK
jgi:hypothetical protein